MTEKTVFSAGLPPEYYTSEEVFKAELSAVFGELWLFFGFARMFKKPQAYIAREMAGRRVFVQNTSAGLRAFINRCPHRGGFFFMDGAGVSPLVCQYHAWSFHENGQLKNIPNASLYAFTEVEKQCLHLQAVALECVGDFLFINFSATPLPIHEQFEAVLQEELRHISSYFDDRLAYAKFSVPFNWKLNMENVKDYNHIRFVHSKSFASVMEMPTLIDDEDSNLVSAVEVSRHLGKLNDLSYSGNANLTLKPDWLVAQVNRFSDENKFYNWLLFPNINLYSVVGKYFVVQQYEPRGPAQIDYHLWMWCAKAKQTGTDFSAVLRDSMIAERRVIEEDNIVLSNVQKNMAAAATPAAHGAYESMLINQSFWIRSQVDACLGQRHKAETQAEPKSC